MESPCLKYTVEGECSTAEQTILGIYCIFCMVQLCIRKKRGNNYNYTVQLCMSNGLEFLTLLSLLTMLPLTIILLSIMLIWLPVTFVSSLPLEQSQLITDSGDTCTCDASAKRCTEYAYHILLLRVLLRVSCASVLGISLYNFYPLVHQSLTG